MKRQFVMHIDNRPTIGTPKNTFFPTGNNKAFWEHKRRFDKHYIATILLVCSALFQVHAQQLFTIPVNDAISLNTLISCDTTSFFVSDTTIHPLYIDTIPRGDTMSICPQNQGQLVTVNFLSFDLAAGDTLFAYDSKIPNMEKLRGKATGYGVSNAFTGWFAAHCAPDSNATGCISFIFKTNGDNGSGSGFRASIGCMERNFQIEQPIINTSLSTCQQSYHLITIPAPKVTANCSPIINDSTIVRIRNSAGKVCVDTCLSYQQSMTLTDTFAFGNYEVIYKLKQDTSIVQQTYFSVQPRAMVCNDTVNIGMGEKCQFYITPDLLLESTCDTITDTMYYEITISTPDEKLGQKVVASGTGKVGDYPFITKELIDFCGKTIYTAEIKRIYYKDLNLSYCNDGIQSNSCWTRLRFEDKKAPHFLVPVQCDTIYACEAEMTPDALGLDTPVAVDNCDSVRVDYVGVEMFDIPTDCDTIQTYLAVWQATDLCGNVATKKDTIKIFRPKRIVPAPDVVLSCGMDDKNVIYDLNRMGVPGLQIGHQKQGVFIPTDTLPLIENANVCNYNVRKSDVQVSVTCNDKYFRHWQLLDWCSKNTVPINIDTQLIEFKDTLAPEIQCGNYTTLETATILDLPADNCQMLVEFPLPMATDKCVQTPLVEEFTVEVLEEGGWWSIAKTLQGAGELECDTFRVGYRAYDNCPHEQLQADTCYRYFIIRDITSPNAICTDNLIISLGGDTTFIHADALDAGSWDMCQLDTILVRRTTCNDISTYQGPDNDYVIQKLGKAVDAKGWGETLTFTCCDVHHPIFAELLVIDKKGNYNTCWTEIKAEDKIPPICQPLPPMTGYCDTYSGFDLGPTTDANGNDDFDDKEWQPLAGELAELYNTKFGDPALSCEDDLNCNNLMVEQEYQLIKLLCGTMNIKRRYRVIDYGKNHSTWEEQTINLDYRPNWTLSFPADVRGDCNARFTEPTESPILNGNCDLLSWDYEDEIFETADDVFTKVLRTYSIINWCTYQPGDKALIIKRKENSQKLVRHPFSITSDSLGNASYIQYTQVMKIVDEEKPLLVMGKIDTVLVGKGDAAPFGEEDQTLGNPPFECDAIRIFQVFARDCNEAISENLLYEWDFMMDGVKIAEGTGDTFHHVVYPGPLYEVKWTVTDVFANSSLIAEYYTFVDGLKPIAYCNNGVVAETTPGNRFVRITAETIDNGSYDNCTDQVDLKRRLWHPVLNIPRPQSAMDVMELPTYLELGCFFLGTQEVSLYIMDEAGNFDYCTTRVNIQNNMLACTRRSVSGAILDQEGSPIEEVAIEVFSTDSNLSVMSNHQGNFEFLMPDGADYTVRPYKNNDPLNGVSTYDLVLISQHILGISSFDSPYKYIAADVNKSGSVTAFDLVQLRQLILSHITEFPNNTSWRFVDIEHKFTDVPTGMQLHENQEEKTIYNLSGDRLGMDFLGVKIGDINGSAVPNRSVQANGRNTQRATFELMIENQFVEQGKTYVIPFYATDFSNITGYQFTLEFPFLELIHIEGGVATLENFGRTMKHRGILTTSWHSLQQMESRETSTPLFTLTFQATKAGYLDELLKITSRQIPAEAYRFGGTFLNVSLAFSEPSPISFQVYQNTPNPFNQHTTIAFDLPRQGTVFLQVVNSQGQVVLKQNHHFRRGYNEVSLNMENFPLGTYYYQLSTPFGMETKKMTKVR